MAVFIIKITGIIVAGFGTAFFIEPNILRNILKYYESEARIKIVCALKILLGVIFLMGAGSTSMPFLILLIGLIMAIGGVYVLVFGFSGMKKIEAWWDKRPDITKKLISIMYFLVGTAIVFAF